MNSQPRSHGFAFSHLSGKSFDKANAALMALLAAGAGLRLWIKTPTDLWEDEIIATTHAVQSLGDVVVDTFRNDIHPPLYFLQLHFWSLISDSDLWFMANSVIWSFLALISLAWVVTKRWGPKTGLAAAATYAVMPSPVHMADQVRMYAMFATLLIWALHFAIAVFKERDTKQFSYTMLIVLQLAIILSHALGALAVLCLGIYAFQACKENRGGYKRWFACYTVAALVAIPCSINASVHGGNVASSAKIGGLVLMLSTSTVGVAAMMHPALAAAGVAVSIAVILIAARQRATFQLLICFAGVPLAIALLGNAVQPFFKWNFFSTLQAPFIAIILAFALSGREKIFAITAAACLVVLLAVSVETKLRLRESSRFVAVSEFIKGHYRIGDVIFVPQQGYFHGLAWYLDGPRWGSPLEIAPPPNSSWRKVYAKLGAKLVNRLGLMPRTDSIANEPYLLLTGVTPTRDVPNARRIWLVSLKRPDLPTGYPPSAFGGLQKQWSVGKNVQVSLYDQQKSNFTGSALGF